MSSSLRFHAVIKELRPVIPNYEMIRIGYPHDGGYLIPDALEDLRYCFSPGVSGNTLLEDQLAEKGIECFLLDGSCDSPIFDHPDMIHFERKYLRASDSADSYSLDTWKLHSIGDYAGDLLMQMDIEGDEYGVLNNVSDALLQQFRILVVEFHNIHLILLDGTILHCFERLCNFFKVVHIHPNNFNFKSTNVFVEGIEIPPVMEFTFLNKKFVNNDAPLVTTLPHPLDRDNTPEHPSLALPECWYR